MSVNRVAVSAGGLGFLLWIIGVVLLAVGLILVIADGNPKTIMIMLFGGLLSWCFSERIP